MTIHQAVDELRTRYAASNVLVTAGVGAGRDGRPSILAWLRDEAEVPPELLGGEWLGWRLELLWAPKQRKRR